MNDVVKVLVEYGLSRDVAEKIDLEARQMHFKESKIDPFKIASEFALDIRIDPVKYAIEWYLRDGLLTRNERLSLIVQTHRSKHPNTMTCYPDRYRHLVGLDQAAQERLGDGDSYHLYFSKTLDALFNEGRCHYCREALQIGNSMYNNWQHYEDRRGYHLTCRTFYRGYSENGKDSGRFIVIYT